jgi:mono/diheme cytochrome c family protein
VYYDPQVQKIMTDNCITCHGGPAPSAGLGLENYVSVKAATQNGKLIDRINDQTSPMPPRGIMPLETRKSIERWTSEGFKEKQ